MPKPQTDPVGPVEYVFVLHGADYTWVNFADAPERDVSVSRGAVMSADDAARLAPNSRADLHRWLKSGDVIARPLGKE